MTASGDVSIEDMLQESGLEPQCPVKAVDFEEMTPIPPDPADDLPDDDPPGEYPRWWQYRTC